jgi:hypothetical protein
MKTWDNFFEGPHTFDPEASFYVGARALNREDYNMEASVPPGSVRFNVEETLQGDLRARLLHYVYQEQIGNYRHTVSYPATWWQHFKQDCFPKWLLERFPVQYNSNSVLLDVQTMYPDYRPLDGYKSQYIVREVHGLRKDS